MPGWTQEQITELEAAIASGAKSIQFDGRRYDLHDPDKNLALLAVMRRSVNSNQTTTRLAKTRKGF